MIVLLIYYFWLHFHAGKCQLLQCIFQTENADKALKYRLYRHLPAYEKIIRNLVSFYFEKDGDLYLGLAAYGTGLTDYDLNSIELYGTEDGKYYITVDTYGDYPVTDENHEMGDTVYIQSEVFITTLNDGILYIEGLDEPIEKEDYNAENERFYMNDVAKFYTNNLNVVYNLTEK